MEQVRSVVAHANAASARVTGAAAEIGQMASTLRTEVTDFLDAMCRHDGDRRAYERMSGNGAKARVTVRGGRPVEAAVRDISRGGIALRFISAAAPGPEVRVELPGSALVSSRILRQEAEHTIIAFHRSTQNLGVLARTLAAMEQSEERPA